jgi:hypothetical protein
MRTALGLFALGAVLVAADTASAWGSQGHQLVGATADKLLGANAAAHLKTELGLSLRVAATWPDCVRAVSNATGTFTYVSNPKFKVWCGVFETRAGQARMIDYARRNWHDCVDDDPGRTCNAKYHFADVAVQRDHYQLGEHGTNDHDVVQAIDAAIAKLQDKPVPAPFNIKTKGEALFLLAHFVGDMHQPLHMGAVYLDKDGALVDPDAAPGDYSLDSTQGGNLILDAGKALHGEWDTIDPKLGVRPKADLLAMAKATPATPGDVATWPAVWATDSVLASHTALANLVFAPGKPAVSHGKPIFKWPVTSPAGYADERATLQKAQIAKAGKRLADVLNAIWP